MHTIDASVPGFTMVFQGTRIVVTSKLISEVLHVPRVDRLDYPSHQRLFSISRDELASLFCEKAKDDFFENFSDWVIHSERHVILSNFSDTSLPDEFRSQG